MRDVGDAFRRYWEFDAGPEFLLDWLYAICVAIPVIAVGLIWTALVCKSRWWQEKHWLGVTFVLLIPLATIGTLGSTPGLNLLSSGALLGILLFGDRGK